MAKHIETVDAILAEGLVAVIRGTEEEVYRIAQAAVKGGIRILEITMTVPNAVRVLKEMKQVYSENSGVVIGMGTVMDKTAATEAIQAGADFIVTPHLDEDIIDVCHQVKVPILPGTFTITEMVKAQKYGCEVLKLFPGGLAGPKYIKDVKGPLPEVKLMPTGGVDETNITEWLQAGAAAIGIGSNLKKAGGPALDEEKMIDYAKLLVQLKEEARYKSI